jgi:hypothetical protein
MSFLFTFLKKEHPDFAFEGAKYRSDDFVCQETCRIREGGVRALK